MTMAAQNSSYDVLPEWIGGIDPAPVAKNNFSVVKGRNTRHANGALTNQAVKKNRPQLVTNDVSLADHRIKVALKKNALNYERIIANT